MEAGGVLLVLVIAMALLSYGQEVWSWFEHSGWNDGATPDPEAQIISLSPQKVKYLKNGAKFKTTVQFSDGFWFVTHATDREQHFMTYNISINAESIRSSATYAHDRAVEKKLKKNAKKQEKETAKLKQEAKKALPLPEETVQDVPVQLPIDEQTTQTQPIQEQSPQVQPEPVIPAEPAPRECELFFRIASGTLAGSSFGGNVGDSLVIGRNPAKCDLPLSQYAQISGAHCRINFDATSARITDLNSTNGTFLNGRRLEPGTTVLLRSGDRLLLADLALECLTQQQ